jgi:photosystem II stability/assembly factor-like uncharacterized protein
MAEKIECPDSNNCFIAVSYNPTPTSKKIYRSTDKGKSWELINSLKIIGNSFEDMSCPDSTNIFLTFFDGSIYYSNDGGTNFESLKLDGINYIRNIAMYNKDIGVASGGYYITHDGWETYYNYYEQLLNENENMSYTLLYPILKNDSILYSIARIFDKSNPSISGFTNHTLLQLNIKTLEYKFHYIGHLSGIRDFYIFDDNNMYVCGSSNTISGGSTNDAIYKSTDAGKTWRRVLDLYYYYNVDDSGGNPFGLQSIAFKDSLTGIAVGQFGKILYTYDAGESWTYESDLPPKLGGGESNPPTMLVRYAGSTPIIAAFNGSFHRLVEDNLAPKPDDTLSISGKVWDGNKGQSGIPIALNTYRITMTDENGYYKFTNLAQGTYSVKALNKYFDGPNELYYYKPYKYEPEQYDFELAKDTTGIDFNAVDIRNYYTLSGSVLDEKGDVIEGVEIQYNNYIYNVISKTTNTDIDGKFNFENLEERRYTLKPITAGYVYTPTQIDIILNRDVTDLLFTATPATSVWESANDSGIILHPNPASEYIFIQPSEGFKPSEGSDIKIFNTLGECVGEIPLSPPLPKGETRIDISHLPRGVYYLRIGNRTQMFVKF